MKLEIEANIKSRVNLYNDIKNGNIIGFSSFFKKLEKEILMYKTKYFYNSFTYSNEFLNTIKNNKDEFLKCYDYFCFEFNKDFSFKSFDEIYKQKELIKDNLINKINDDNTSEIKKINYKKYLDNDELNKLFYPILYKAYIRSDRKDLINNSVNKDEIINVINYNNNELLEYSNELTNKNELKYIRDLINKNINYISEIDNKKIRN